MQFRESNLETIQLVNGPADFDGVLVDSTGVVIALWSSFAWESGRELQQENRGVAIGIVQDMLRRVQTKKPVYSLETELMPQPLASARRLGLSDAWLKKLEDASPNQRQALSIARLVGGSPAVGRLKQGDILLAIDEKVVTRFREVELAVADKANVSVTVWRDGEEKVVPLATAALTGHDIDRVVMWGGATLQAPHRAMIAQRGIPPEGVYVGYFSLRFAGHAIWAVPGSPHRRSGRRPDSGSGRLPQGGFGAAGPLGHPLAHHHVEQRTRSDHPETGSTLLAYIRAQSDRGRLGAARS